MNAPAAPTPAPPERRPPARRAGAPDTTDQTASDRSDGTGPVSLHIGRLLLDGLELGPRDAALLQRSLEAGLSARLGGGALLPSPGALDRKSVV